MDFGFSEEQEMLRSSARDFLAKEAPMTYVRKMMDDERGYTDELWRKMDGLGWMGLILPEEVGGSGLDFVDMVVVLEEMGRAVLPGPFFSTVILAGVAIAEGGSAAQKAAYLSKIADGSLKATLAHLEPSGRWDADGIQLEAKPDGGGYVLTGTKLFVPDANVVDLYVVAADPRAVHERAVAAGAKVTRELNETDYGSFEFGFADPEGNQWSVGTYPGEPRKT